jgi:hypothetical protein
MTGPLTYRPEIMIESKIDLPPEYESRAFQTQRLSAELCFELVVLTIEVVGNLLDHL